MYGKTVDRMSGYIPPGDFRGDSQPFHIASMGHDKAIQGLFWFDFTPFTHFNPLTNKRVCIIFVHNLGYRG